jgi:hypothetical protein
MFDGRRAIIEIDDSQKTVYFDAYRLKKITGTRVAPILGVSEFSTPFKAACEIAGLYPGDKPNKYTEAGNVVEPTLRRYATENTEEISRLLGRDGPVKIEEPVPGDKCGYDHFHNEKLFGGLVDGYVNADGHRDAVLEIKTSSSREKWDDGSGGYTKVPEQYMLQASLYAELSNLDKVVFLVGFLEESDYSRPKQWVPDEENSFLIVKDKLDMREPMEQCAGWYNEYVRQGFTPEWSDKDADVLKYLRAFKG